MQTISDFPYFEMQFNKEGAIHNEEEVKQILDFLAGSEVTDLFVISHGWNNDMNEARMLYKGFFAKVRNEINETRPPEIGLRKFAVLGILWPSIKFADDAFIAGGAASVGVENGEKEEMRTQLELLKGTFDNPDADKRLEQAIQLLDLVEEDDNAASEFVDLIRSLPHKQEIHPDDGSDEFFKIPVDKLVDILKRPDIIVPSEGIGGGAASFNASIGPLDSGGAASFNFFGGVISALRKVLNFTTYFQMKERAGIVGRTGAYRVLTQIRDAHQDLKIHLIGHSFGGRLVTALADGPAGMKPIVPASLTLLQAAFSHNGFASRFDGSRDGFFRKVVTEKKIKGPILITHSDKDIAVGIAYPIASKLSGDDSATFGGPDNHYGGIGRNGAQFTPEANNDNPLGPVTSIYHFQAGKLYNLEANTIIMGHSDIIKNEIAHALLCAVISL